jgi:DNA repair protein SbcC/Rad50
MSASTAYLSISLEQFGCYRIPKTVEFKTKSVSLLQGKSGRGKTTICDAIQFALYGKPKKISWGERSCRVILQLQDWVVTRTGTRADKTLKDEKTSNESSVNKIKGGTSSQSGKKEIPPRNSLILQINNSVYKEAEAQSLIDQKFGVNFTVTSYITQKDVASFFSLSPADRIHFLEQVALADTDISQLKKQIKTEISQRKQKLTEAAAETRFTLTESSKYSQPEEIKCPLDKPWTEIRSKNERIKQKRNDKALKEALANLASLSALHATFLANREKKQQLSDELQLEEETLSNLETNLNNIPLQNIPELESRINFLRMNKELLDLRAQYKNEEQTYNSEMESERKELEENLSKYSQDTIIPDKTSELRAQIKAKEQKGRLTEKLGEIKAELQELDSPEIYQKALLDLQGEESKLTKELAAALEAETLKKCPNCQACLRLVNGELQRHNIPFVPERNKKELNKALEELRSQRSDYLSSMHEAKQLLNECSEIENTLSTIPTIDESKNYEALLRKHIESLKTQQLNQEKIKELQYKLKNNFYSSRLQLKAKNLKFLESKIQTLEKKQVGQKFGDPDQDDLESLGNELSSARVSAEKRRSLEERIRTSKARCGTLKEKIGKIPLEEKDYSKLIDEKTEEIKQFQENEKLLSSRISQLGEYEKYLEALHIWKEWRDKLSRAQEQEKIAISDLSVAERFMRIVQESEGNAVINLIDNINIHLETYISRFFEDPMSVEITPFKETKEGEKLSVQIQVFYRGCNCKISELSGGEQARLELAICLTINSLGNSSLLLLDECFSSLDAETSEEILELLKTYASEQNKLVISICHQASEGAFNSVVNL